ncbi:MAG: hypothetical protein ACYTGG_10735 [Planctomycetota bacterium]|jgi:hypothetical protein
MRHPPRPERRTQCAGTSCRLLVIALLAAGSSGCSGRLVGNASAGEGEAATAGASRITDLVSNDHGLSVRQWSVLDHPELIASTLSAHAAGDALDAATRERLRRNGLRLVAVPAVDLDRIVEKLGGAPMNVDVWYGQVFEWRELLERPVPGPGQAIALDGHVRRYAGGDLRLMCRCWTVQMEDGPSMLLEMIPQYRHEGTDSLVRLLGGPAPVAESFPSLALDLVLEAGFAYVVTTESPDLDWPDLAGDGATIAPGDLPASSTARDPTASGPGVGPAAAGPPTLGEWLFRNQRQPPTRGILILVPRIPTELWPDAG